MNGVVVPHAEINDGYVQPQAPVWNRPRRIILIRHAESEGNVDETVYQASGKKGGGRVGGVHSSMEVDSMRRLRWWPSALSLAATYKS